jgi:predicted  nucleic acid-binding Zn-ribbon protein
VSTTEDAGRLRLLIDQDTGYDVDGLMREYEKIPRAIYNLRQQIAPARAELAMLKARYDSKGRSPSHFDLQRSLVLSELTEEIRDSWERDPEKKRKLTDGRAKDMAHAHKRYRDLMAEARDDWKRIGELGAQISKVFDKIEGMKGRKEFLAAKLEQVKALTYAWSAESRLGK